jgi:hypothetical protein
LVDDCHELDFRSTRPISIEDFLDGELRLH